MICSPWRGSSRHAQSWTPLRRCSSAGLFKPTTWQPNSVLDDPRILKDADARYAHELKTNDRETAIPWNSPKFSRSRAPVLRGYHHLPSGKEPPLVAVGKLSGLLATRCANTADSSGFKIDDSAITLLADPKAIEKDPNQVLLLWQRLWHDMSNRPTAMEQLVDLAVRTDFYSLTSQSITFLTHVLSSCHPLDTAAVFFKRVRNSLIESSVPYTPDEAASLMWSLNKVDEEMMDEDLEGSIMSILHGNTSQLSWLNLCQVAMICRTYGNWYVALHIDIYQRYDMESKDMSTVDLLCFALSYRRSLGAQDTKQLDVVEQALADLSLKVGKASLQERLNAFSLLAPFAHGISNSQVPHVIMAYLEGNVSDLSLDDSLSIFSSLRRMSSFRARTLTKRCLRMYKQHLPNLPTSKLVLACFTALCQQCALEAPIEDVCSRSENELRVFAKTSTANSLDLWRVHTHAIAFRKGVGLPRSVSRLCQVQALKAAEAISRDMQDNVPGDEVATALAEGFNTCRSLGRRAVKQDVATNVVLPTGLCLAAAMLFDKHWKLASWDDYPGKVPFLSQNLQQVEENISWEKLDMDVRRYGVNLRESGFRPLGLAILPDMYYLEKQHDIRVMSEFGWAITVVSLKEWRAAVAAGDTQLLVTSKVFSPVEKKQADIGQHRVRVDPVKGWHPRWRDF